MCTYCLQRKVVLIVETKFRVWRLSNVLNATFLVLILQAFSYYLLLCIGHIKPVCVAQEQNLFGGLTSNTINYTHKKII